MPHRTVASCVFLPAKLLVIFVRFEYADQVLAAAKQAGSTGGTKVLGRGTAFYMPDGGLPEADAPEKIIFSVVPEGWDNIMEGIDQAARAGNFSGLALLIDVPAMLLRPDATAWANNEHNLDGSANMESGTTLITGIISHGQADEIMAVARNSGAKGGTILDARGTGTEDDVKFFGISLASDKEMLLIVAENDSAPAILEAISNLPIFSEPGGGIVYTTKVDRFLLLGR